MVKEILVEAAVAEGAKLLSQLDQEDFPVDSMFWVVEPSRVIAGASWLTFSEGVVYRWTGDSVTGDLGCVVSDSELAESLERERKLSRGPKLLFSMRGRRVTLRFHPQHGRVGGRTALQQTFELALHRSFPDCSVTWL